MICLCDYCCSVCACRLMFGIQPWCGMYYSQLWMHYKFQTLVGRTKSCYSPTVNLQRFLENFTGIGVYTMAISQNHSSALFLKKTLWELCAVTTRGPPQWIHVSGSKALLTRGMCSALFIAVLLQVLLTICPYQCMAIVACCLLSSIIVTFWVLHTNKNPWNFCFIQTLSSWGRLKNLVCFSSSSSCAWYSLQGIWSCRHFIW